MDNSAIYKKTLGFSLRRALWDLLVLLVLGGACTAGFFIAEETTDKGLVGLGIGAVIGIIIMVIILRFVSYYLKAGQIAMMTRGIVEGKLPDDVIAEGKKAVKERFTTVAVFYAATGVIKGIFNQLGRVITRVGESVGGDAGSTVGSAISTAIQVVVSYLCDCCLGWVFFRKDKGAVRATCEGAVLFFKHGKTFAKNMGRIFGMTLLSLLAIGGVFAGIFYLIFSFFPAAFERFALEFAAANAEETDTMTRILSNPKTLAIAAAVLAGILIWSVIHSAFVRPFILTGVLRNYLLAGKEDIPTEESFAMLDSKSPKFAKLRKQLD